MKNENERLKLPPVPLFKVEEIELFEYIDAIYKYSFKVHEETKDFGFSITDSGNFFLYLCRNSSEPQYKLMRTIKMKTLFYEDKGDGLWSAEDVAEFFAMIEDLKDHVKSLNQLTYKDINIRAIAEAYYSDGLEGKDIVKTLIKLKILEEYNEQNSPIDHLRTINRWIKDFKKYDVIRESNKY